MLAFAELVLVVSDLSVVGSIVPGRAPLAGWAFALVLICLAPFHATTPRHAASGGGAVASVPIVGGAISLGLLMHAALSGGSALTIWLARGALAAGLLRAVLLIAENMALLRGARADATTDKLTSLPNRRALNEDLDRAFANGGPHTLAFFDLDGFKEYNDAVGHGAGRRAPATPRARRSRPSPAAAARTGSAATSSACSPTVRWRTARR